MKRFKMTRLAGGVLCLGLSFPLGLFTLMLMIGEGSVYDKYFDGMHDGLLMLIFLLSAGGTLFLVGQSVYLLAVEFKNEADLKGTKPPS
jgi:hypothetical protein